MYQHPQYPAKRPRFGGKLLFSGTSIHSSISLTNTTVYAVTPLQGSPLCAVPRSIRESSPHRSHYCMLHAIRCPSYRGQWVVDTRRWPVNNVILSKCLQKCMYHAGTAASITVASKFRRTITEPPRQSALKCPSSHACAIIQPR